MGKKIINWAMTSLASFLVFVAGIGVNPNSIFVWYEPDIPESLK
jgi:cyclic lactone autoinducer peptide